MDFDSLRIVLGWIFKLVALTIVAYWLAQGLRKIGAVLQRLWKTLQHWQDWKTSAAPSLKTLTRLLQRWWLKS